MPDIQTHTQSGPVAAVDPAAEINQLKADVVISRHVAAAAGAGLIPLPVVDLAAVAGIQLSMLAQICSIYGQPFSREAAKSVIASLVGGAVGAGASVWTIGSRLKFIPVIGTVASWVVTPAASGVATYAIGKVFVHHLANGGTLFSFEANKMKGYTEKAIAQGKKLVPHWGTRPLVEDPAPAPSV